MIAQNVATENEIDNRNGAANSVVVSNALRGNPIGEVLVLDTNTASALWALLGRLDEIPAHLTAPNHRKDLEALYARR